MDSNILIAWGATSKKYDKGSFIFMEGEEARFYFQIVIGQVKMFNLNEEGKEFTQGIFEVGESFGEPPLFIDERYPSTAVACKSTVVLRLSKERFFRILEEYRPIERDFLKLLARRVYIKAKTAKEVINNNPEHRILSILDQYKIKHCLELGRSHIQLTRQELANLTGLRVETVIRTLKAMKNQNKVDIIKRKLYY